MSPTLYEPLSEMPHGKAYLADLLPFMATLDAASVNLAFTSPPYALHFKKEYGNAEYVLLDSRLRLVPAKASVPASYASLKVAITGP